MYQNYIFDFYGTLADIRTDEENPFLWKKMSEIYSAFGAAYEAVELQQAFRGLEREVQEGIGGEDAEPDLTQVFALLYERKQVPCDPVQAKMTAVTFRALSREKFHLNPRESIMIGNDESADIAGARRVGMDSLYIHTAISPKEYGKIEATYRVMDGDFRRIRDLILRENAF